MRIFLFSFLIFFAGCGVYVPNEIVLLAADVSNVQRETSLALIKSIDADIASGNRTESEVKSLNDLKDRLNYLIRGNDALVKSMASQLSTEELAELIKKYKLNKEKTNELPRRLLKRQ